MIVSEAEEQMPNLWQRDLVRTSGLGAAFPFAAALRSCQADSACFSCRTIMCVADAEAAVDAGSEFIVTPVLLPEVTGYTALPTLSILCRL